MKYFLVVLLFVSSFTPTKADALKVHVFEEHALYLKYSRSYSVAWQLLSKAAEKANIPLELEPVVWVRAITLLKKQKSDYLVFGTLPSEERKQWATFSNPLSIEHIALYSRLDSTLVADHIPAQSADLIIGVTKGSIHHSIAVENGFKNVVTFSNRNTVFEMLEAEKLDAIIYTNALTSFYCGKYYLLENDSCVKKIGEPFKKTTLHFIYDKNRANTHLKVSKIQHEVLKLYQQGFVKKLFVTNGYSLADYNLWQEAYLSSQRR